MRIRGRAVRGLGVGARYVSMREYREWLGGLLGCTPYPGTLNLHTSVDWRLLAACCEPLVARPGGGLGAVYAWRGSVAGRRVLVIRPLLSAHPPVVLELVACGRLGAGVGEVVEVEVECRGAGPTPCASSPSADPCSY